ncbi:LysR family transcriptional regulator [Photobacterium sp.]|uniref:LysR family transcriptional regulator n=1 Tax=Photobacterium sp. TaxID=660 RepID=UPI00299E44A8|nr:LysR family transcriptional regulator [Photobacterium sp.]MDX1301431.1 LysR family transcriptional regulator [Photobacterium sp.]
MFEPRLLRAFVSLADTGSFTLAADHLHLTQSTVSQQINRLEDIVGWELFDRTQRPIKLTSTGEKLLGYVRKILSLQFEAQALLSNPAGSASIKIGLPDDIATSDMTLAFADFAKQNKENHLDVTTGLSLDLIQRFRNDEFDIIVVKESTPASDRRSVFPEPMAWYESIDLHPPWTEPLPLITFPPGGLYRDTMFERINHEGKHWYVAFSSSSINNVLSAVEAGLGITLLPVGATIGRRVRPFKGFGNELPMVITLYSNNERPAVEKLSENMSSVLYSRFLYTIQSQQKSDIAT